MAAKDTSVFSPLQRERLKYQPEIPPTFKSKNISITKSEPISVTSNDERIKETFKNTYTDKKLCVTSTESEMPKTPMNVGVVLSGGQAPGGHNVISGVFDYIKENNQESRLFGFLGGPKGIFTNKYMEITQENLAPYRNQGGFDIIGSGRDKISTQEQMDQCLKTCSELNLDGLVIIGGDDSNTNAAVLAEYFAEHQAKTKVIGAPKTIDGDLKNDQIEISFGFDTACKVYSNLIGNIAVDSNSAKKYYHFIRLMGRAASHITMECALQTRPNVVFISEEVAQKQNSLHQLVQHLVDVIVKRADQGKNFGVVLIPEGLPDFIPELHTLISELNDILSKEENNPEKIQEHLSSSSRALFSFLPPNVRAQLLMDRDSHGNVQLSKIETEKLLVDLAKDELKKRSKNGSFQGKFSAVTHFFGYEGRCSLPSKFDCDYCYSLGYTTGALIRLQQTGVMACISHLHRPVSEWEASGVPLATMMHMERRKGKETPVIKKSLVELDQPAFQAFAENRDKWALNEHYASPGPIQFHGEAAELRSNVIGPK
eukprot:gb/GECH01014032.1/.p1 GENE.gb/GECH01014032.1/~~gb/GECH01014032.1/.p1  ORF type:complete len:542 (+),score=179.47 gb/GECH01014032.1/:1-1626(+)